MLGFDSVRMEFIGNIFIELKIHIACTICLLLKAEVLNRKSVAIFDH